MMDFSIYLYLCEELARTKPRAGTFGYGWYCRHIGPILDNPVGYGATLEQAHADWIRKMRREIRIMAGAPF